MPTTPTVLTVTKADIFIPVWMLVAVNLSGSAITAPTDATTALATTWSQMGYISDAGIVITPTKNRNSIKAAQFGVVVANPVTDSGLTFKATLLEQNIAALRVAFGLAVTQAAGGGALAINPGASAGALQTCIDAYDATGRCLRTYFPSAEAGVDGDLEVITGQARTIDLLWTAYPDALNNCAYEYYSWLITGAI